MSYFLEKLHHVLLFSFFFFSNFGKERREKTVNMPRQYFDIREDEQLSIKIRKYLCLFDISNAGYKEKDRVENTWKEIND